MPRNAPQRRSGPDEAFGGQANVASTIYYIASGKIRFRQAPREQNTADALTKHWTPDAKKHVAGMSFEASRVDSAC